MVSKLLDINILGVDLQKVFALNQLWQESLLEQTFLSDIKVNPSNGKKKKGDNLIVYLKSFRKLLDSLECTSTKLN